MTDYNLWTGLTLDTTPAVTDRIVKMAGSTAAFDSAELDAIARVHTGTAFPSANLYDGYPFNRTDIGEGLGCFYDASNTRWLTHRYTLNLGLNTITTNSFDRKRLNTGDNAIYLPDEVTTTTNVATTNDNSNYWTITVTLFSSTFGGGTVIHTFDTRTDSASTWTEHDEVPDDRTPTNGAVAQLSASKTGSPGALQVYFGTFYQFIIT